MVINSAGVTYLWIAHTKKQIAIVAELTEFHYGVFTCSTSYIVFATD